MCLLLRFSVAPKTSNYCWHGRDTVRAPVIGTGIGTDPSRRRNYYAAARDDFAKILKLAEKNPSYKPVVSLWWSFLGQQLEAINDSDKEVLF